MLLCRLLCREAPLGPWGSAAVAWWRARVAYAAEFRAVEHVAEIVMNDPRVWSSAAAVVAAAVGTARRGRLP